MNRSPRLSRLIGIAAMLGALVLADAPVHSLGAAAADDRPAQFASAQVAAAPGPEPKAPAVAVIVPARLEPWGSAPSVVVGARPAPTISGVSAILIDEASGKVLYEKAAHERLSPASLTKIMTALIALERGVASDVVEVTVNGQAMRGSTVMGLVPGERLTLEDLVYGMMLPSGNDAALAIAEHIGGSVPAFVELMNKRAAELGMADTRWVNPHGLDSGAPHTTAYDLVVLTRTAMQREDFRTIANTRYRVVKGSIATYSLGTLNPLYGRLAGVDGVKTGYTRTAQQTLVGTVTRDGHRVMVVIMRSPDRASDGVALLNWAFEAHAWPANAAFPSDGAYASDGLPSPGT